MFTKSKCLGTGRIFLLRHVYSFCKVKVIHLELTQQSSISWVTIKPNYKQEENKNRIYNTSFTDYVTVRVE